MKMLQTLFFFLMFSGLQNLVTIPSFIDEGLCMVDRLLHNKDNILLSASTTWGKRVVHPWVQCASEDLGVIDSNHFSAYCASLVLPASEK